MYKALNRKFNSIARKHTGLMTTRQLIDVESCGRFDRHSRSMVTAYIADRTKLVAYTLDGEPLYSK